MTPAAPTLSSAPEDATLSDEQQAVIERALRGENLFITGNAGTGKSFLLHHLKDLLGPQLTAATGVAALQLKGETIHSWAGLGIGDKSAREIVAGLRNRKMQWGDRTLDRMQRTSMLVIDEVSMLSDDLIDLLDGVLSIARDSDEVFGGVQMLMVGDMLQLPPVSRDEEVGFAFEADAWRQANVGVMMLTKVFRQEEEYFSRILSKIRFDEIDDEVAAFLEERYHAEDPDPEHPACILHTHNYGCEGINNKMLAGLPGPVTEKIAIDTGKHENFKKQLDRDCRAPAKLRLKVGARVMLLVNLDLPAGLANGSMGFVEAIGNSFITVRFDNGVVRPIERMMWEFKKAEVVVASREQFPLMLARAVTIHKSQGMTLDKVEAHLAKCFSPGQSYVALSRARTSGGLFLRGPGVTISAHPKAVAFYKNHLNA
jgi:ATP-dependent DNA helicase PIF1